MKRVRLLILCFLPLISIAQQPQLVLTHITVIDIKTGTLYKNRSVTISGNRITNIDSSLNIPQGATTIDATGKFLIPGLWDMHVHLSFYGEAALPMLIANGITGVRDMGGNLTQIDKWRSEIEAGTRIGPRIKRAGPFIDGPKKMSALRASFTRISPNENAARLLVDSLKNIGVDFIKIHSRLPHDIFFAVADEANKLHLPFAVHLPKDVRPEEASAAGARSIEHTESLMGDVIYEEDTDVRDRRTDSVLKQLYGTYGKRIAETIAANKNFYTPTLISLYKVKGTDYEKALGPKLLPVVSELHNAKVRLLTGSDFAGKEAGIQPGFDLHGELDLFVQAGMTPLEALQTATINPAECLYLEDSLGTIEKGKIADLVILNANPLENISNTRRIHAVITNGKYLPSDSSLFNR